MINNSSIASHKLDSLAGAIGAFEGIREAHTLLVGPLACKTYLTHTANLQAPLIHSASSANCLNNFPFSQRRVPCTYIDEQDFVYGTEEKLMKALTSFEAKRCGLLGVINHSGTSLIGDDLNRIVHNSNIKIKTTLIDSAGFTGTYAEGFKNAVIKILETIVKDNSEKAPRSVNIIGSTIFHYNWANDIAELKRMLELLGIKVVSVICADESLANLEQAGQAELNLVTHEEYGDAIALFLEKEFGTPHLDLDLLSPFGLGPSEAWFKSVADCFDISYEKIDSESKRVRTKCYPALARCSSRNDIKGLTFGIFGDSSQVAPLLSFLHQHLGLYPVVVGLNEMGSNSYEAIKQYLKANSMDTSILINPDQYEILDCLNLRTPDLLFGSSVEKYISQLLNVEQPRFIPISFPYNEKVLLTARPLMGFNGSLTIIEDIINSFTL